MAIFGSIFFLALLTCLTVSLLYGLFQCIRKLLRRHTTEKDDSWLPLRQNDISHQTRHGIMAHEMKRLQKNLNHPQHHKGHQQSRPSAYSHMNSRSIAAEMPGLAVNRKYRRMSVPDLKYVKNSGELELTHLSNLHINKRVSTSTGNLERTHNHQKLSRIPPQRYSSTCDDNIDHVSGQNDELQARGIHLDLGVYDRERDSLLCPKNIHGLGWVNFSLWFNEEEEILLICVHELKYLISSRCKEKSCFYFKILLESSIRPRQSSNWSSNLNLDDQQESVGKKSSRFTPWALYTYRHSRSRFSTNVGPSAGETLCEKRSIEKKAYRHAEYDEMFEFKEQTREKLATSVLRIFVKEKMGHRETNRLLGIAEFLLSDLLLYAPIKLAIENINRDLQPAPTDNSIRSGWVHISICWDPPKHKLFFGVIEFADIIIPEKITCFMVRVALLRDQEVVKSYESHWSKQKLYEQHTDTTAFPVQVMDGEKAEEDIYSMCVSLIALRTSKMKSHSFLLGKCFIGSSEYCNNKQSIDDWFEASKHPGMVQLQWHKLL